VVTRLVRFDPHGESSVDLLLSLNGLPFATLELKNALTGQTVVQAKAQYADRDFKLPLFVFKQRALVHFAVDTDDVYMTTRLSGRRTFFLPFNRGNSGGKGNPTIEGEPYKTSYLWRQVLARDSILDVLARLGETDIALTSGEVGEVRGPTAVGTRKATDEQVPLHEVIEILNERFGTDFTKSDQLVVEQIIEDGKADARSKRASPRTASRTSASRSKRRSRA